MNFRDELDLLDQAQVEAEQSADEQALTGIDRRHFVFMSLVTAAAGVFGLGADVTAQGGAAAAGQPQPAAPAALPLGNGDSVSWTFQPYPGGTGALHGETRPRARRRGVSTRRVCPRARGPARCRPRPTRSRFCPRTGSRRSSRRKRITSVELTKIYLDRIERLDPTLLCAVTIMATRRWRKPRGPTPISRPASIAAPLHGIPYGVKDLFSTKGVRTTWGSKDFENRIIDEDAEVVVRLRNAGAVLIAKLATGLFAQGDQWYRGRTNNPWDIRRGSSGSSAGPSSATAAGCVAFGIGTETSGSIVSPARECGLSALRPTFGRVSRYGGMVLAWSQDRVGPICRTIEDCAMVFNVIHGVDPKDPSTVTMPFQFDPQHQSRVAAHRRRRRRRRRSSWTAARAGREADRFGRAPQLPEAAAGSAPSRPRRSTRTCIWKAKELGIDLATIPEPQRGGGGGRGARGAGGDAGAARGAAGAASAAGAAGAAGGAAGAAGAPVAAAGAGAAMRGTRPAWPRSHAGRTGGSRAGSTS